MNNDTVLRWDDGYIAAPLADQLRARPNMWAVIEDGLPDMAAGAAIRQLRGRLGPEFEADLQPCDDGPYGVIYELRARYSTEEDWPVRPSTPTACEDCGHSWSSHEPDDWERASRGLWIEYPCREPGCDCPDAQPTVAEVLAAQAEARRSLRPSPDARTTG